ncbi:MAG: biotin--[acetyl-CoA-carboxylase] ligase [Candidatus Marinamargulisbacteria bacterium]
MGIKVISKKIIDSTNDHAKRVLKKHPELLNDGFLVIADQQTNGKGTHGKSWYSKSSGGLYYTLGFIPKEFDFNSIESYHLQISKCIQHSIQRLTGVTVEIRYPNDLYLKNKKIGGILMESEMSSGPTQKLDFLIIGIGLNINQTSFPSSLMDKATSLHLETKTTYQKLKLVKPITKQLFQLFNHPIIES